MRIVAMVAVVALAGCAAMQPGQGVDQTFASRWGCSYTQVMSRADTLERRLPEGKMWIPQVGWNACELMARNGRPDRVDVQTSEYGRSASWWYEVDGDSGYTDLKLISLEQRSGGWIVTYTGM